MRNPFKIEPYQPFVMGEGDTADDAVMHAIRQRAIRDRNARAIRNREKLMRAVLVVVALLSLFGGLLWH